ncbi:ribosome biogenesis GTPase YlqF [Oscillospiraceae bacterium MB08-C2-2]|nr:ribosome biogenesis GTPase YlqF [Oscillospiraceae bacterium MB08-C2-2]
MEAVSVQWFPGHMAKTRRLMRENMRLVDIVVELRDARIPHSSSNPEIDKLTAHKPRIILLNKADTADELQSQRWCAYYMSRQVPALAVDCRSGKGLGAFVPLVRQTLAAQLKRLEEKGMSGRPIRIMVVGVPNVGKSSFINRMAGSRRAKVEDRPGVTRGKQWVKLQSGMELLDMPGVLWPKFDDKQVGEYLAFTGAVKDDIMDLEALAMRLLELLWQRYPQLICSRYGMESEQLEGKTSYEMLSAIGQKRGMLLPGGVVHTERAAIMILDEFRGGTIGRITLEQAPILRD